MPASPWSRCSLCNVINKSIKQQWHCKKVNDQFCKTGIDLPNWIGMNHFVLWGLLDLYHEQINNRTLLLRNIWMLQKKTYNQWQCRTSRPLREHYQQMTKPVCLSWKHTSVHQSEFCCLGHPWNCYKCQLSTRQFEREIVNEYMKQSKITTCKG